MAPAVPFARPRCVRQPGSAAYGHSVHRLGSGSLHGPSVPRSKVAPVAREVEQQPPAGLRVADPRPLDHALLRSAISLIVATLFSSAAASGLVTLSTRDRLRALVRSNVFDAAWHRRGVKLPSYSHRVRVFVQDEGGASIARVLVLVAVMLHLGGMGSLRRIEFM